MIDTLANLDIGIAPEYILGLIAVWNIFVFALYAIDKSRAKARRRRISESTLLAVTFLIGSLGALLAMLLLRHKTKTIKFALFVPLLFVLQFVGSLYLYIILFT